MAKKKPKKKSKRDQAAKAAVEEAIEINAKEAIDAFQHEQKREMNTEAARKLIGLMLNQDGVILAQRCKMPPIVRQVRAILMQDLEMHILGDCAIIQPRVPSAHQDIIDMRAFDRAMAEDGVSVQPFVVPRKIRRK